MPDDPKEITAENAELRARMDDLAAAARKVILCFPAEMPSEEGEFNIPAYAIDDLRKAAENAKEKP